jgi:integrase
MKKSNLTAKGIARLLKRPGRYRDDGPARGLLLCVTGSNNASWQLRYEIGGKERWLGLGSVRDFSLKEARERARAARQKLADGIDPLAAKRDERTAKALAAARTLTFAEAATQYFDQHSAKWTNRKHRAQFLSTLRAYAFPVLGKLPVSAIDTGLVLKVLEPHWPTKAATMSRTRNRIEAVLDWCGVRGYRSGDNPARWRGHLDQVLPAVAKVAKVNHHAALPYSELPAFMTDLRTHEGVTARALEFLILTGARTNEINGAQRDEINFGEKTWTVPAPRMKAKKDHRVPLSGPAIELLRALPREEGNGHLFIGVQRGAGLSHSSMAVLAHRLRPDVTVHGFRSTFRDWASERTNFPPHIAEMALAHTVGNAVERAYRRGDLYDKRRKLMEAWARYCMSKPTEAIAKVIPLRNARQ